MPSVWQKLGNPVHGLSTFANFTHALCSVVPTSKDGTARIDDDSVDDRRIPVVSREWSRFALNAFLMLIFDQEILA
jgi:hypothetical protein